MKMNWVKLLLSIIVCLSAGFIGSFFTSSSVSSWYPSLTKPFFTPPSWVFAPVWTLLYILMGISIYLVWMKGLQEPGVKTAVMVFGAQLILNLLWSFLFFGLQSPFLGFMEIIILWLTIITYTYLSYGISKPASLLFIPYLAWTSFALLLNLRIWQLNP